MINNLLFSTGYEGFVLPLEATVSVCVAVAVPVGVAERVRVLTGRTPQLPALCLPRAAGTRVTVRLNRETVLCDGVSIFECADLKCLNWIEDAFVTCYMVVVFKFNEEVKIIWHENHLPCREILCRPHGWLGGGGWSSCFLGWILVKKKSMRHLCTPH